LTRPLRYGGAVDPPPTLEGRLTAPYAISSYNRLMGVTP
jgi:hypothetical protein